jgi:diguanylate cyclase (GGDEF)-like protein
LRGFFVSGQSCCAVGLKNRASPLQARQTKAYGADGATCKFGWVRCLLSVAGAGAKEMMGVGVVLHAPWLGAVVWALVGSCMRSEATRRGVDLTLKTALTSDDQITLLNELLDQGMDALIFKPISISNPELLPLLDRASAAGVPVVTLDSFIDHDAVACTVRVDNEAAQMQVAEVALNQLGHRGRVVYFQGDQRLPPGVARKAGFDRLLARYPQIELVHEVMLDWVVPGSRIAFGAQCMRDALAANRTPPDALISASDEGALGALQVLEQAGLAGKVLITGFDGLSEALIAIRDGNMLATIRQVPDDFGARAMDAAVAAVNARRQADVQALPRIRHVGTELITRDNLMEATIDTLSLLPKLIIDLGQDQLIQRELQQAVITRQRKILDTVAAISTVFNHIREPQSLVQNLVDRLCADFSLYSAKAIPEADSFLFLPCSSHAPGHAADDSAEQSRWVLPMVFAGKTLGRLELCAMQPRAFDQQTREILESIANQGAIALENASLYADTVRLAQIELQAAESKLELSRQAEHMSLHDALTGVPNRRLLSRLLEQAIARAQRNGDTLALMFLDLDHFKQVNDIMGHEAGDALLQEAARRLKGCVREGDTVARLGGDEFVVLLTGLMGPTDPAMVGQKMLSAIGQPFALSGQMFRLSASIGIALYPDDGKDESTLTKNADIAMYHAKMGGKNSYQFHSARLNANSLERLALEAGLRNALERDEFHLYYQTKQDAETDRITGMEVFLRWEHPDLGLVQPLQFLAVAEQTGLIVPIGKWVIKTACAQNVAWQKLGLPHLAISVNLTPRQFSDATLASDIRAILQATGMEARLLELEIPEKVLMQDNPRTLEVLKQLKQDGIRIAIDDFGMAYTALAMLQQFPIDTVKIDRALIRGGPDALSIESLTEAIIAMGRTLSRTIVVKGVETHAQADSLRGHVCHEIQGFYSNRPVPPEQLTAILQKQD